MDDPEESALYYDVYDVLCVTWFATVVTTARPQSVELNGGHFNFVIGAFLPQGTSFL